jgi:hypothetical protein
MSNRKTEASLEYLNRRLDQVSMGDYERLVAKANLARAEAVSQFLLEATRGLRGLLRTLVLRPIRRLASTLG